MADDERASAENDAAELRKLVEQYRAVREEETRKAWKRILTGR